MNPENQLTRTQSFNRALNYKFNVFQLAKRVRRATRNGRSAIAILKRHRPVAAFNSHSANRAKLAFYLLQSSERTIRVAKFYCAAFNIPTTEKSFSF